MVISSLPFAEEKTEPLDVRALFHHLSSLPVEGTGHSDFSPGC